MSITNFTIAKAAYEVAGILGHLEPQLADGVEAFRALLVGIYPSLAPADGIAGGGPIAEAGPTKPPTGP